MTQITAEVKIGQRRVQQIWAVYCKTGSAPVLKDSSRPEIYFINLVQKAPK